MADIVTSDLILAEYIQDRARKSNKEVALIAAQVNRERVYELIYALHSRFMKGEFSLGHMAEQLEITKPDLYHLLDAMGLKVGLQGVSW